MAEVNLLIHLPLLRIEEEQLRFDAGLLYRLPFDRYNELTIGTFSRQTIT